MLKWVSFNTHTYFIQNKVKLLLHWRLYNFPLLLTLLKVIQDHSCLYKSTFTNLMISRCFRSLHISDGPPKLSILMDDIANISIFEVSNWFCFRTEFPKVFGFADQQVGGGERGDGSMLSGQQAVAQLHLHGDGHTHPCKWSTWACAWQLAIQVGMCPDACLPLLWLGSKRFTMQ